MADLTDQIYIQKIIDALWSGRLHGRAAVMVGSGFSLNAKRRSNSGLVFPTWAQLGRKLVDRLYPHLIGTSEERDHALRQAQSISGALRLAEEYKAAFGQDSLDQFLIAEVPDQSYEPSDLHRLLLKLPWSDVFTTNFDTLLERGAIGLVDRKYDVIRTIQDIPGATKPRIVKLHGTFPSTRPFIFSEEDFRTYPRVFAPFVNLAQQAVMENVFVLVGFSGDDPNFLYWTGWVRDNLGRSAPQIYLCGLLALTNARRKMLYERNVIPIDLSPLFPPADWPDKGVRHAKALEWLLLTLEAGEPPNVLTWPRPILPSLTPPSAGIPEIRKTTNRFATEELSPNTKVAPPQEQVNTVLDAWCTNRKLYPGWLVAPNGNRATLWAFTQPWILYLLGQLSSLSIRQRLKLLFELNWRLEKCLVPLWPEIVTQIVDVIGRINPFPALLQIESEVQLTTENAQTEDWISIRETWIYLVLAVLRYYRALEPQKFEHWKAILAKVQNENPELGSYLAYEQCLFSLARMNHKDTRILVDAWNPIEADPYWNVRKAAVLAEIGDVAEAVKLLDIALKNIRNRIKPEIDDFPLLSREGWAMKLRNGLNLLILKKERDTDYRGRWEKLANYRCNPGPDLDLLEAELNQPPPFEEPEFEVKGFDLGSRSTTFQMTSRGLWDQLLPALQVTRMIDEVAYPPSCGRVILSRALLLRAAEWLETSLPEHVMAILLRAGDFKAVQRFFSRYRVATLPSVQVDALHELVRQSLSYASERVENLKENREIEQRTAAAKQMSIALELLSRIMLRLREDQLEEELNLAVTLYSSPSLAVAFQHDSGMFNFFKRLLETMNPDRIGSRLLDIVSLPIAGTKELPIDPAGAWPEPLQLTPDTLIPPSRSENLDQWGVAVGALLKATADDGHVRRRSVVRLSRLYQYKILTDDEQKQFAAFLWNTLDSESQLPKVIGLPHSAYLVLPEPNPGIAAERFRQYYVSRSLEPIVKRSHNADGSTISSVGFGGDHGHMLREITAGTYQRNGSTSAWNRKLVDWSFDEVKLMMDKVATWWLEEGRTLCSAELEPMMQQNVRTRIAATIEFLRVVVTPRCKEGDEVAVKAIQLTDQMQECEIAVHHVLPGLLKLAPERFDGVNDEFRKALVSSSRDHVASAIQGIYLWLNAVGASGIPSPPLDLVHEIGNIIRTRRQSGLTAALDCASAIIRNHSGSVDKVLMDSVSVGLRYLLEEAKYPKDGAVLSRSFSATDVPLYRALSARLASFLAKTEYASLPVVQEWMKSAADDPLPEVRRAVTEV